MSELDTLIAEAELGEEARTFLQSDLGKILLGMAEQEVQSALLDFKDADPSDRQKIASIQDRVRAGTWFKDWLGELVIRGDESLKVFRQRSVNE